MTSPAVVVWCDDASHPPRRPRVFVAEFTKPGGFTWQALPQKRRQPGVKWWADPDGSNVHVEPDAGESPLLHHRLSCRYCKRPLELRPGKLDAILNEIHATGRVHATMGELRAILNASRRDPEPDPG